MSTLSKAYQDAIEKMEDKVDEACKAKEHERVDVIYATYEFDQYDTPIYNLDDVPLKGKVKFIDQDALKEGNFFDFMFDNQEDNPYESFESEVMDSPTWLELAVLTNEMIQITNNRHHVYLEDVVVIEVKDDGVQIAMIQMGS
jgi:hypothetical protein